MFESVLVANRGEIAVRVMRTLRALGVRSVAVYSDADEKALHVRVADAAVRIGPPPARLSYLSVDAVIEAALASRAQAIHPGYGFLSEQPTLARACDAAGIVFVGPPASAIEAMGDKIAAKATVAAAGVPVVPGSTGAGLDQSALAAAALEVGFPVLLKPSAGGGGKGMRLVEHEADLAAAIESARREARNSFGDDTLLLERFVRNPRHIEIQVLADNHGNVVHLGERECSLQRRHQKIIEEAPSVLLTRERRAAMGEQAVAAAKACGYAGAGTVEFIVSSDRPDEFYFMEMNTRLQVEHPVTELVYGIDLVEQQLSVACGEPLGFQQSALIPNGHAVEARVYAEDPDHGFLPTGGDVVALRFPTGDGVRVDAGIDAGSRVGSDYDPMLAKVIAWAPDRGEALARLDQALADTAVLGLRTNIGFLRRLVADADVISGRIDTGLVERRLPELVGDEPPLAALAVVALAPLRAAHRSTDAWAQLTNWRHGTPAATRRVLDVAGIGLFDISLTPLAGVASEGGLDRARVWCEPPHRDSAAGEPPALVDVSFSELDSGRWRVDIDATSVDVDLAWQGRTAYASVAGSSWSIAELDPRARRGDADGGSHGGEVRSPMPGTVISIVAAGEQVVAGQTVAVVEAMKMEHSLTSAFDGVVAEVHAVAGGAVALGQTLALIVKEES